MVTRTMMGGTPIPGVVAGKEKAEVHVLDRTNILTFHNLWR